MYDRVIRGGGRGRSVAVAAEIGCNGPETAGGESADLVAPRVPELGEAVDKHHHGAGAFLRHVHVNAVDGQLSVLDALHFGRISGKERDRDKERWSGEVLLRLGSGEGTSEHDGNCCRRHYFKSQHKDNAFPIKFKENSSVRILKSHK